MTIETLNKRIDGKKKELDKLTKKLSRIEVARSFNYEQKNPYYYHESDYTYTLRDIENCKKSLADYEEELRVQIEKDNSRDVKVIIDFINNWKQKCHEYYETNFINIFDMEDEVHRLGKEYSSCDYGTEEYILAKKNYDELHAEYYENLHGKFRTLTKEERLKNPKYRYVCSVKVADGKWEQFNQYLRGNLNDSLVYVDKLLEEEGKRKYDFIIERTNYIVGQITDASNLYIGNTGELNGYIIGTNGRAKVETIGAGGYNIQRFHFRTLINRLK